MAGDCASITAAYRLSQQLSTSQESQDDGMHVVDDKDHSTPQSKEMEALPSRNWPPGRSLFQSWGPVDPGLASRLL